MTPATSMTIREEKTCPACEGNGKPYGPRLCRRCHGRTTVTETTVITIEADDEEAER